MVHFVDASQEESDGCELRMQGVRVAMYFEKKVCGDMDEGSMRSGVHDFEGGWNPVYSF